MIEVSGAVMVHPSRPEPGIRLVRSARPGFLDLVADPEPSGPPTGLRTAIRAWSSIPGGSTHHLVLEDDAELCPGFEEAARSAAEARPDAAISFHTNWSSRSAAAVRLAALTGERWAPTAHEYTPTVALLLPAEVGAGFAAFARRHGGTWADDVVMARYLTAAGVRGYATVPNLVEHGDLPSVTENDHHGLRLSACYADRSPDADWTPGSASPPPALPFFKFGMALVALRRSSTGRPLTVDWRRGAAQLGVDPAECARTFREAMAGPARPLVDSFPVRLDDRVLAALWNTAYAMGTCARHADRYPVPRDQAEAWAADPLALRALDTVAPGGLCTALTASQIGKLREPASAFVRQAAVAGLTAARPAAAVRGGPIVVVAPGGNPLAQYLAEDLADRGRQVSLSTAGDPAGAGAVVRVPAGATELHVAAPSGAEITLRLGAVYGPGIDCPPLTDFVSRSLVKEPISVPAEAPAQHYVHVWDVAAAVDAALDAGPGSSVTEIPATGPVGPLALARTVTEVVKPVPVDAAGQDDVPAPDAGGHAGIPLGDGVRTVAQWLAYEAK